MAERFIIEKILTLEKKVKDIFIFNFNIAQND